MVQLTCIGCALAGFAGFGSTPKALKRVTMNWKSGNRRRLTGQIMAEHRSKNPRVKRLARNRSGH